MCGRYTITEDLAGLEVLVRFCHRADQNRPLVGTSIPSSEAARHVSERCTVEGYVASVHATGRGTVFLNFDNSYPHETFTAVSLHGELSAGDLQLSASGQNRPVESE